MHMQQAMKRRETLEPVWNDLDTFDKWGGQELVGYDFAYTG